MRAWERAGFVEVSRHEPDDEHTAPWILMEFRRGELGACSRHGIDGHRALRRRDGRRLVLPSFLRLAGVHILGRF